MIVIAGRLSLLGFVFKPVSWLAGDSSLRQTFSLRIHLVERQSLRPICPSTIISYFWSPEASLCTSASRSMTGPIVFSLDRNIPVTAPLIAWLDDCGRVHCGLRLSVGVSCLPPLSSWEHGKPPCCLSGILRDLFRPATHTVGWWLCYRSPTRVSARLVVLVVYDLHTFTSHQWCHPMTLSRSLLDHSPFSKESSLWLGYGWVDYSFGLRCVSFPDGLEVFLLLQVC